MIFRAFFTESAPLRRLSPLRKQKNRYLCNFFAITDSSLLLKARKQPFLPHFRAAIRVLAPRDNPQSQKSCNPSRFFVSGFLGSPNQCWSVAGPIRDGGSARYGAGWTRYGVAKLGWRGVLGYLPAYRVASLLSRKISNATLLKLVFRYNGRRGFVEDQASD